LLVSGALTLYAQNPDAVREHVDAAKRVAGRDWSTAADYFCSESAVANRPTDPAIEPTKLFDNIYAIGSVGTTVYVIQTSEGLILLDAGYPDQVESVLLAGMKKLDLDPARVRYVLITHGHSDHFGAAKYFQDTYKSKVLMSAADWELLTAPDAGKGKGPAVATPTRDQAITSGQPIILGDTTILPLAVPGHTPGAVAFVFPALDKGVRHTAGLFGGTVLTSGFVSTPNLRIYIDSVASYADFARQNKVDVELQNHPLMDGFASKLERLKTRNARDTNPFVVGEVQYKAFVDVISECAQAQLARRKD